METPSPTFSPGARDERATTTWKRVALVAIALALVATGRSFLTPPVDRPVARTVIPLPAGYKLPDHWASLDLSPDGKLVAFVAQSDGEPELFLRALDELDAKPIVDTEGARLPFFSPDGQWVGFDSGGNGLRKVPVSGGAPVSIAELGAHSGTSWGPDGRIVYTRCSNDILSFDDASIAVLSLETGESRILIEGGMYARYSGTGHLVYARDASLLAVAFDLNALEVTGTPVSVLEGVASFPSTGAALFAISSNGSLLYAPGGALGHDRRVLLVV